MHTDIIWDAHSCFPLRKNADMSALQRYRNAGVHFLSINVGMDFNPVSEIMDVIAYFRRYINLHHRECVLVHRTEEIIAAKNAGQLAIAFDLEGGVPLGQNLDMVAYYHALGIRQMLLAYNQDNALCGGCQGSGTGLTDFGRRVIQEMNRIGMVVDLSHMSLRSSLEALDTSETPAIFSHSNPKALCHHARNIDDEQIKACSQRGGVIGINGIGLFLGDDTSTKNIVRNIDYVVQLVGIDHVGVGLDFVVDQQEIIDFMAAHPDSYPSAHHDTLLNYAQPEQWQEIPNQLHQLGYQPPDIAKIMGGNFFRVASHVW